MPDFDVGGTERWTLALAKELSSLDWRRSVTQGPRLDAEAERVFQDWLRVPITDIPPDAIVIAPCEAALLARHSAKVIAVAHGMNDYYKNLFADGGYFKGVAVSEIAREAFPSGVDVTTLHNGVDLARLSPRRSREEVRAALGIPTAAIVIGSVGRWSAGKRPLAAAQAAAAIPGAVALYVGPDLQEAATAIADSRFVPAAEAEPIGDIYRAMDVCLITSRTEGFSLVAAEAWFCGVPLVSTPVGIVLEHPDLATPLPQEPSGSDLVAAVRIALARDQDALLQKGRRLVQDRYTSAHMGMRWRRYLEAIVNAEFE